MRIDGRIVYSSILITLLIAASCTPAPIYKGHPRKKKVSSRQTPAPARREPPAAPAAAKVGFRPPLNRYSASRINSSFGIRRHPRYHTSEMHTGIDLEAALGEEVLASAAGKVIFTGKQGSYGKVVIIEHQEGICSVYAHLSAIAVGKGTVVSAGQYIGNVGLTGNATGAHLHFEIRVRGKAVDPEAYIR